MKIVQKTLVTTSSNTVVLNPLATGGVFTVRVTNVSTGKVSIKLYFTSATTNPEEKECVEFGTKLTQGDVYLSMGEVFDAGEGIVLSCTGDAPKIAVRVSGFTE